MIDLEKFNLSLLLLLPLAMKEYVTYKDLFKEDVEALENGFMYDINRPWLANHVMLLIDQNKKDYYTLEPIAKLENFKSKLSISIKGNHYDEYVIALEETYKEDISLALSSSFKNMSPESKVKIVLFWQAGHDSRLFNMLFQGANEIIDMKSESVPEEDYIEIPYKIINDQYTL